MFPGISQRDMQKAMKKLGIRQEEIDAELVIIKTADKDLIIKNPHVSKVDMMGQKTFQIVGDVSELARNANTGISEDDIETVVMQANCTRQEALEALDKSNGNLAEAILKLQNK